MTLKQRLERLESRPVRNIGDELSVAVEVFYAVHGRHPTPEEIEEERRQLLTLPKIKTKEELRRTTEEVARIISKIE